MKKIIIIGLATVSLVAIGYAITTGSENIQTNNTDPIHWQKEAPQLFNNDIYLELKKSAPTTYRTESTNSLIGSITNPFGIRDDILERIIKTIPSNNESAMKAAIKMMQHRQQLYYGKVTESEALLLASKDDLAGLCLSIYLNKDINYHSKDSVDDVYKLRITMRDTKARDNHLWDIDTKYFSWKAMGTGLSTYEEKQACNNGRF